MTAQSSVQEPHPSQSLLPFQNRTEAGRILGAILNRYAGFPDLLVLALPRGGVPVAFEVARALGATLDVFLVRKLGAPHQPELAMGAVASGGIRVLNTDVIGAYGFSPEQIEAATNRELSELARREQAYRGERPELDVVGRTVILVDDGLATGSTMRAAVKALRKRRPARVVAAVPVAAPEAIEALRSEVDGLVSVATPSPFFAVGRWYTDFSPTMDREIRRLMEWSSQKQLAAS